MKRPKAHQIDERAMRIFRDSLPPPWVPAEQKPDYAKDYLVEIATGDDLTGVMFFVQLKGEEQPTLAKDGSSVTFYLKTKHAVYYLDKLAVPVFLVVVDVTKKVAYWVFVQAYLRDQVKSAAWRKKGSVLVRIPTENKLTDTDSLRKAVEEARDYMAALHPAALKNSLAAQRRRIESLDPRFAVSIDIINNQEHYRVNAKEPVEITVTLKGKPKELSSKIENLIGKGLPTSFGPDEIEVTGSPLFTESLKAGGILYSAAKLDSTLSLTAVDASGRPISALDNINGTLTGGEQECRFEGGMADSPLIIHITAQREGGSGPIRLRFDARKWMGQPLLYLAYFDQLSVFFEGVRTSSSIDLKCLLRGNVLFSGRIRDKDLALFKGIAWFVSILAKARSIATKLSISPTLNEKIDHDKAEEIEILHQLLTEGEFRKKLPGVRIMARRRNNATYHACYQKQCLRHENTRFSAEYSGFSP